MFNSSSSHSFDSYSPSQMSSAIICPIGILSSILSICAFWRQAFTEKNIFFVTMLIISIFDLLYNVLYLVNKWGSSLAYLVTIGPLFSSSLISDLCALYLTIERFVALRFATELRAWDERKKRMLRLLVSTSMGFIGSWRLHYILQGVIKLELIQDGELVRQARNLSLGLTILTDMFLPFVLIILMLVFSCLITVEVWTRQKKKRVQVKPSIESNAGSQISVTPRGSNQQGATGSSLKSPAAESADRIRSLTTLVLILDIFFILNQLGYCALTVAHIRRSVCGWCPEGIRLYDVFEFIGDFIECLHHSMNFYFYIGLSSLARREFMRFLRGLKGPVSCR